MSVDDSSWVELQWDLRWVDQVSMTRPTSHLHHRTHHCHYPHSVYSLPYHFILHIIASLQSFAPDLKPIYSRNHFPVVFLVVSGLPSQNWTWTGLTVYWLFVSVSSVFLFCGYVATQNWPHRQLLYGLPYSIVCFSEAILFLLLNKKYPLITRTGYRIVSVSDTYSVQALCVVEPLYEEKSANFFIKS